MADVGPGVGKIKGDNAESTDDYVSFLLAQEEPRPPITWNNWWKEVYWGRGVTLMVVMPLCTFFAAYHTPLYTNTAIWMTVYYFMSGMGITAGHHRLWAHRSYNAARVLEYLLALLAAASVQGPIIWWARGHRAHHRYTDTDLDPYNARQGLLWTHIGWVIAKPRRRHGKVDVSDLKRNDIVMWQYRYYPWLVLAMAIAFPTLVAGIGWGDWKGGYVYAAFLRLVIVHHSSSCVNSLAHWLGEAPFDDKHSPRDHLFTALVSLGEGYHNFHHQFPMDYRNAFKWYQYDPTKWLIWLCSKIGLASHLKTFPENEIQKGMLSMELKHLFKKQEELAWPHGGLPVVSWATYKSQAELRPLLCIAGFIHDLEGFMDEHPGGKHILCQYIGKDATAAFFGGVYNHGNAAHNLLAMKRVGMLQCGTPHVTEEKYIPPSQLLRVAHVKELSNQAVY
ncbi:delta 9-fatty acid desaturase protein [Scleroderma citrinum]